LFARPSGAPKVRFDNASCNCESSKTADDQRMFALWRFRAMAVSRVVDV
jgi:hypothetical protein